MQISRPLLSIDEPKGLVLRERLQRWPVTPILQTSPECWSDSHVCLQVRYTARKLNADRRPRYKGRFIKAADLSALDVN